MMHSAFKKNIINGDIGIGNNFKGKNLSGLDWHQRALPSAAD